MNLKQAILSNKGMHQDLSISKDTQEYAYKNINIRIQATGDGTLASVTNIKSPLKVSDTVMKGRVLNSIMCGEYIVVFTHMDVPDVNTPNVKDYIYRIDLDNIGNTPDNSINVLYAGDLNFSYDKPIDSTFYYENDNIQKVYWVDGWTTDGINNYPRVINIISDGERNGGDFTTYNADTNFDFYPEIKYVPTINVVKNFGIPSELPAGVIQYFVSFFNKNQSETLIAAGTSLYSIDLKSRGAKADETGCAFDVTIQIENESTVQDEWSSSYGYIRLYSVRRTSINGDATVSIVKDFKIEENVTSYSVLDNGIGETIDPGQIFFVGGTPLFAKTLCQKDNTLFVGGIKTEAVTLDKATKDAIEALIKVTKDEKDKVVFEEAVILTEGYKKLPVSGDAFNSYYPYKLQKDSESLLHKTFKVGEIYRFGVQFQNKQGQWSEVVWIGDKKIANVPTYDSVDSTFNVSNIKLVAADIPGAYASIRDDLKDLFTDLKKNKGFVNYRLLMADPETSNGRSIIAQGVVSPTLFSPSSRAENKPHTINSWIMRPRGGVAPYHHLEPLNPANCEASELSTYDPNETINENSTYSFHNMPFEFIPIDSNEYPKESLDNNFYVDESILSMYSPELNFDTLIGGNPRFRIIGIAPLKTNYSAVSIETENIGIDLNYTPGIDLNTLIQYKVNDGSNENINPLYSEYMYLSPSWSAQPVTQCHYLYSYDTALYNIHMWQHSKSIIGFNINEDWVGLPGDTSTRLPAEPLILKTNHFYNHLFSKSSEYFPSYNIKEYYLNLGIGMYKDEKEYILFKEGSGYSDLYSGNFDFLHTNEKTNIYRKDLYRSEGYQEGQITYRDKEVRASSHIIFNSTPHAIFSLGKSENKLNILPKLNNETLYNGIFTGKYNVLFRYNDPDLYDTIDNKWKDLTISGSNITEQDTFLKNYFNKKLSAVGCKLGASWVDNFALYREGIKTDVYDPSATQKYKTCCAIDTGNHNFYEADSRFDNYDYKERYNGLDYYTIIHKSTNGGLVKRYWYNKNDRSSTISVQLTDDELNVLYPLLEGGNINNYQGQGSGWVNVTWETPEDTGKFPFLKCWKEWDPYSDTYIYRSDEILIESFPAFTGEYQFEQNTINLDSPNKPYLFIGELYYNIRYSDLYGGYNQEDLDKLNWIPISKPTPLMTGDGHLYTDTYGNTSEVWGDVGSTTVTEGDTYYQRWDCLKTYPKSVNDMNQVTDITSFMVETHINLDDRTDANRANFNTLVTPATFNLFNTVYNQKNNLFSYTTLNDLLSNENSHQVSWSLAKNIAGDVDTWTNITSASAVNLKHPITKLINFNNKVVGLTEHSVEVINFNAKNLVPTDNNTFIELKNSAKVDGTIDFTVDKGTRNKSVLVTEAGLYFIDDNENSLIRLSYNGEIQNLGVGRLDSWFKQNIVPGTYTMYNPNALHLEYDAKYKDVYICNDTSVLVYNEFLNEFTSFVDYQELVSLFTNKGKTYAISHTGLDSHLYSLYDGSNYGIGFYNKELPYSIHYRVNPGPYTDKVFTNVEFTADLSTTQENTHTSNSKPFDYIQAWTEYQDTGRQPLTYDRLSTLREKFRTWRAFIPRNNGTRDRIRNPWVHLKLDKSTNSEHEKLEFHNIAITYME